MNPFASANGTSGLPAPALNAGSSFARTRIRQRLILAIAVFCFAFFATRQASQLYGPWDLESLRRGTWKDFYRPVGKPIWHPEMTLDGDYVRHLQTVPLEDHGTETVQPPPHHPAPHRPPPPPLPNAIPAIPPESHYEADLEAPELPPIREPPVLVLHPHSLPSALENPWPDQPEIASQYLRADLESIPPPEPAWPDDQDVRTVPLDKKLQVSFKKFVWSGDYRDRKPPGRRKQLPKIQFDFQTGPPETSDRRTEREARQQWVKRAMVHAWNGYKQHAWGHDEIRPVASHAWDAFNGWGATIIDSLDTLLLMDLPEEYNFARTHVQALDFTLLTGGASAYGAADGVTLPTFETTIRYLGGLLGAFDVSGDSLMLQRAQELGDWMLGAFNTRTGIPQGRYLLGSDPKGGTTGRVVLSEAGSMTLEYTRLWQATGEQGYWDIVQRLTNVFDTAFESEHRLGRLLPGSVYPEAPSTMSGAYSFSAQCDSYYEYLIKEHLLLGGGSEQFGRMYSEAVDSAYDHIIRDITTVPGESLRTIGEHAFGNFRPTLDHLTCFAGAMMGIGARLLERPKDLETAEMFSYSCFWAYNSTASGLGPETVVFYQEKDADRFATKSDPDGTPYREMRGDPIGVRWGSGAQSYGGRPETIESVFYMYRLTGDPVWQDRAWQMFVAWVSNGITTSGFAGLMDVHGRNGHKKDSQESFVLAETMKYYYLVFSDPNFVSLDDWVFNTEAHPFRLRPEEELRSPVSTWTGPNLETNRRYLEVAHGGSIGRGTAIQRQFRAMHPPNSVKGMLPGVAAGNNGEAARAKGRVGRDFSGNGRLR